MRKQEFFEIDGYKYSATQMICTNALVVTAQLAKMLAPLTKGLKVPKGTKVSVNSVMESMGGLDIGTIIENILEKFDEEKTIKLAIKLLGCVKHFESEVEIGEEMKTIRGAGMLGTKEAMDNHFSGDGMKRLFPVIKKSLEVNFADFFPETSDLKSE